MDCEKQIFYARKGVSITDAEQIKSCIIGHAVGDALGVPVEFYEREALDKHPVSTMEGFGTYPVPAGSWSDDTSMTLCALDALARKNFSWEFVMVNFGRWYYHDEFTPTGEMFDVGNTCSYAIDDYFAHHVDLEHCGRQDEHSNGNGSLMRIIPFVLYAPNDITMTEKASSLTHAHRRSQIACGIYAMILRELIRTKEKGAYRMGLHQAVMCYDNDPEWKYFEPLLSIENRTRDSIRSSGYVVDSLEAALWCLITTDSYRDCVLKAVNLGDDTDTVAAIAGGLAGALYGYQSIPNEWLETLIKRNEIEKLCEKASIAWQTE